MLSKKGSCGAGSSLNVIVGSVQKVIGMAGLSAATKNRVAEVLDSTHFRKHGFTLKYNDENNPLVAISFSSSPEYQFAINSTDQGEFTTSERPGIHSDAAETFRWSNFELCLDALKEWAKRIDDRETDWIMDEFGGVADRNPSIPTR
jgi:hypothetical protein